MRSACNRICNRPDSSVLSVLLVLLALLLLLLLFFSYPVITLGSWFEIVTKWYEIVPGSKHSRIYTTLLIICMIKHVSHT